VHEAFVLSRLAVLGSAATRRPVKVVGVALDEGLLTLKLRAARHRDLADVVELLKLRSDAEYIEIACQVPASLRPALARLRDDALEELRSI
jgi:sirohydrochlorin ferrochelatase